MSLTGIFFLWIRKDGQTDSNGCGFPPLHAHWPDTVAARLQQVARHFPSSLGVDDFIARLEIALFAHGFTGDNSIGPPSLRSPACPS